MFKTPIIVFANGSYPTHRIPLKALADAGTIICTDGSVTKLEARGLSAQVIIGDMDSVHYNEQTFGGLWITGNNQSKTDLEKCFDWCVENGIKKITIIGAVGERDDHSFANLVLLAYFSGKLDMTVLTDYFIINSLSFKRTFKSFKGQTVSIIPLGKVKHITATNLKYSLTNEPLRYTTEGISNVSLGNEFSIQTSGQILVFRSYRNE